MQSNIINNIKEQVTLTTQKKSPEQNHKSKKAAETDLNGNAANLTDDIVELSAPQTFTQNSSDGKKVSKPVTNEEKSALFDSFSGMRTFSIYS